MAPARRSCPDNSLNSAPDAHGLTAGRPAERLSPLSTFIPPLSPTPDVRNPGRDGGQFASLPSLGLLRVPARPDRVPGCSQQGSHGAKAAEALSTRRNDPSAIHRRTRGPTSMLPVPDGLLESPVTRCVFDAASDALFLCRLDDGAVLEANPAAGGLSVRP